MRNVLLKVFVGLAITSIGVFGADNSIGTWRRNTEKSKSIPPSTVKTLSIKHEAIDGGVKVTVTGDRTDGTSINSSNSIKYDGKDTAVTGAPWDTISMKQIDANTFTSEAKKTGTKYHTTGKTVISKDGRTMTTTVKGTNADGKPYSGTFVYDKQ